MINVETIQEEKIQKDESIQITNTKIYRFAFYVSFLYLALILNVITYFFYSKITNELNFKLPYYSVFSPTSSTELLNLDRTNKAYYIETLLNATSERELNSLVNSIGAEGNKIVLFEKLKSAFYKNNYKEKNSIIQLEKLQGNIITINNINLFTESSYRVIVEKGIIPSFKFSQDSGFTSTFVDLEIKFDEENKLKDVIITNNEYMNKVRENKKILNFVMQDIKNFYKLMNEFVLNSPIVFSIRNSTIEKFELKNSTFIGEDISAVVTINNQDYLILISNSKISRITSL